MRESNFRWQELSMAAVSMCNDSDGFSRWLETRLLQLNDELDAGVFVTYINGILESYSGYEEKKDSLLDIVGEIAVRYFTHTRFIYHVDIISEELYLSWSQNPAEITKSHQIAFKSHPSVLK